MIVRKNNGYVEFTRVGCIVTMTIYVVPVTLSGPWGTTKLCDVPQGYRPRDQFRQKASLSDMDNDKSCGIWCNKAEVYAANFGGSGFSGSTSISCTASWHTVDPMPD